MSSVQQNAIKHKIGLLNLAAELGNGDRRYRLCSRATSLRSATCLQRTAPARYLCLPLRGAFRLALEDLESFKKRLSHLERHVAETGDTLNPRCHITDTLVSYHASYYI